MAALPAVLYAIQNILAQVGYDNLDPLTFNLLNQTKVSQSISPSEPTYAVTGRT